jgi:hypothetical protein
MTFGLVVKSPPDQVKSEEHDCVGDWMSAVCSVFILT